MGMRAGLATSLPDRTDPVAKEPDGDRGRFHGIADKVVTEFCLGHVVHGNDEAPDAQVILHVARWAIAMPRPSAAAW